MSVLVFDPAYSRYMIRLGKELAQRLNCSCEAVLSAYAYKIYCPDVNTHVYKLPKDPLIQPQSTDLTSSDIVWGREKTEEYKPLYFTWLSKVFDDCQPRLCVLHNEKFLLCSLVIELCKKWDIPYIVLERGAYRPFTTTCDQKGTNANSSFRQLEHDENADILDMKEKYRIGVARKAEKLIYLRFGIFLIILMLENIIQPNKRILQHKKFSVLSYVMIALGFARRKIPSLGNYSCASGCRRSSRRKLPEKYILVPLQRPGDTQLTFVDDYPGMQTFIDLVTESIGHAAPEFELLFKTHPYDTATYNFHGHRNEQQESISALLENAVLVLTYNSTAGFEALCQNVPVVCLGESFYTKESYVYKPASMHPDDMALTVRKALEGGRKRDGKDIMANVLFYYQVPGSMYKYDIKDIAAGASHIMSSLHRS